MLFAAAIVVERPADVENGYSLTAPLAYHFGHKSPDGNTQLYNQLVSQLAEIINMRSEANNKCTFVIFHITEWVRWPLPDNQGFFSARSKLLHGITNAIARHHFSGGQLDMS